MKILVLPGDGIGPEVTVQAVKVLTRGRRERMRARIDRGADRRARASRPPAIPLPAGDARSCPQGGRDSVRCRRRSGRGNPAVRRAARKRPAAVAPGAGAVREFRPAFMFPELVGASTLKPEVVDGLDIVILRELNGDAYLRRAARGSSSTRAANARASTRCATPNRRSSASRTWPSARAGALAQGVLRRQGQRARSVAVVARSGDESGTGVSRRRADARVRRRGGDDADPRAQAVRRHRRRQHLRRHPVGRGGDAGRLHRHAAVGLARNGIARASTSPSTGRRRTSPARTSPILSRRSCRWP